MKFQSIFEIWHLTTSYLVSKQLMEILLIVHSKHCLDFWFRVGNWHCIKNKCLNNLFLKIAQIVLTKLLIYQHRKIFTFLNKSSFCSTLIVDNVHLLNFDWHFAFSFTVYLDVKKNCIESKLRNNLFKFKDHKSLFWTVIKELFYLTI